MTTYRLKWFATFEIPNPADEDRWFRGGGAGGIAVLVDLLARTALWPELDVLGRGFAEGAALDRDPAAVKRQLASSDVYVLARGGPRATAHTDEAELVVRIDVSPFQLELQVHAGGAALDRLGPAVLDDVTQVIVGLHDAWRGWAYLTQCAVTPVGLDYARLSPRQAADSHRWLAAIVDIVATDPPDGADDEAVGESRAIASAAPPGATRREHAGLVVLRWVTDPRDAAAVAEATSRHEAWLASVIKTRPIKH